MGSGPGEPSGWKQHGGLRREWWGPQFIGHQPLNVFLPEKGSDQEETSPLEGHMPSNTPADSASQSESSQWARGRGCPSVWPTTSR